VDDRGHARRSRSSEAESLPDDDPTGWFEQLYVRAQAGEAIVPWARDEPNRLLVEWTRARGLAGEGRRALVVGTGLGDDAELVASLGFDTVAFDIAPTAIAVARRRFPASPVHYLVADLLDPPAAWRRAFDFVLESITVQALPPSWHPSAIAVVADMVAPGGTLLVISAAREASVHVDGPPWPLTRDEMDAFTAHGLSPVRVEDLRDASDRSFRRWRAEYERLRSS
jgi:ubiquinone/menaquinone biosynthesis C-methylase UbiE